MGSEHTDCPQASTHGNPFRYCACGWMEAPEPRPARADPAWVLARYDEAKELLEEVYSSPRGVPLPSDVLAGIETFQHQTLMDGCTTMDSDCACNTRHVG